MRKSQKISKFQLKNHIPELQITYFLQAQDLIVTIKMDLQESNKKDAS